MSSICPNCGNLTDGGVCKNCQMKNAKQNNTKKAETQGDQMSIVSGICFSIVALFLITVFSWAYSYGNHVITCIAEERAAIEREKAASECYETAVSLYKNGNYYEALQMILNEYNVNYRDALPEKDAEIDELYNLIEQSFYESIMTLTDEAAVEAGNAYIENFPKGKHLKEINLLIATNKYPDALLFIKHLDPVRNSNGTYYFKGYIAGYEFAQVPKIHIIGLNGKTLSVTNSRLNYSTYVTRTGEYGVVLHDLMYYPSKIKGVLLEFVYDRNGNFVELRQNGRSVIPGYY